MSSEEIDALVIGAGCVGLAVAYAIARRGLSVVVIEREAAIGTGVSARNSEVIHAGLHYPPGSIKARLCVKGRRLLYRFLDMHNVAHRRCGKFIVATEPDEIVALEALARRATENDVEGISWIDGAEARDAEPGLRCVSALSSPDSGILDTHGYMLALSGEAEAHGGIIALNTPFLGATPTAHGLDVRVGGAEPYRLNARCLINAAGLGAQECAHAIDGYPSESIPKLHYGKGSYFALTGVKAPFERLIYPLPIPGALGMHYRKDLGGVARFGPDLEFVATEDYRVDPERAAHFYAAARRFWPALQDGALVADYAGVRPKLHALGEAQTDWRVDTAMPNVVSVFGLESPGLTSSLALGEEIALAALEQDSFHTS